MPTTSRGPAIRTTVSSAAANVAGGRSVARTTRVPSVMRLVSTANAPRSDKHSSAGRQVVVRADPEEVVVHEDAVDAGRLGRLRDAQSARRDPR